MVLLDLSGAEEVRFGNQDALAVRVGDVLVWEKPENQFVVGNMATIPQVDVSHPYTTGAESDEIRWTANYEEALAETDTVEVYRPGTTSVRLRRSVITGLTNNLAPIVGVGGAWLGDQVSSHRWTLQGGLTYTVSVMVKVNVSGPVRLRVWSSVDGRLVGAAPITSQESTQIPEDGWVKRSLTFTVPGTEPVFGALDIRVNTTGTVTLNDRAWLQDCVLVEGTQPAEYVDGDMAGNMWEAEPNRSQTLIPAA